MTLCTPDVYDMNTIFNMLTVCYESNLRLQLFIDMVACFFLECRMFKNFYIYRHVIFDDIKWCFEIDAISLTPGERNYFVDFV